MALSNLTGWNGNNAGSACGASDKPEEKPAERPKIASMPRQLKAGTQ